MSSYLSCILIESIATLPPRTTSMLENLFLKTFNIELFFASVRTDSIKILSFPISFTRNLKTCAIWNTTLLETQIEDMGIGELLGLGLETMLVSLCLKIISVLITVILYGRMIEIYLYVSVAPIPFSTFTNREWGSIGNNYVKALLALGFQGFFMMVCVAIYAVLVNAITVADNLHTAIWSVAAYTVILCFSLFKTSSLAKSIFNAH